MLRIKRYLLLSLLLVLTINITTAQEIIPLPQPATELPFMTDPNTKGDVEFQNSDVSHLIRQESIIRAPPPNDNFANAYDFGTLTGPDGISLNFVEEATVESGELTFCGGRNNSVWFKFNLQTATTIDIDTWGTNYDNVLTLYQEASNGELSFKACNDDGNGTPFAELYDVALKAGTYYLQVNDYGSTGLASPSVSFIDIRPSNVGLPQGFYLYLPSSYGYPTAPSRFLWYTSERADTYRLVIQRSASDDGNPLGLVTELPGLTPQADGDGLACTESSICTFILPPAEAAKLIGNTDTYVWSVVAYNTHGDKIGYGNTDYSGQEFYIVSDALPYNFSLSGPAGEYTTVPTVYNWYESVGATLYNFSLATAARVEIISKNALTPAEDSDPLDCVWQTYQEYCTLTLSEGEAALIAENTEYEWYAEGVNSNGVTQQCCQNFIVDSTPLPFDFSLYPPNGGMLIDLEANFVFYVYEAYYADTYSITVNRTAPVAGNIFTKTGLTPTDADADNFYCYHGSSEKNPGACYYTPTEAEKALLTNGEYDFSSTAANENGSKAALNNPVPFYVRADLAYELITPPADSSYAEVVNYPSATTWENIQVGDWIPTYQHYTLSSLLVNYSLSMRFLTPIADFDRLSCVGATCILDISGTELGLFRTQFQWYVYSYGSVTSGSVAVLNVGSGTKFTIGDVPESSQLMLNPSFEDKVERATLPADWAAKNLVNAGVKCNKDKDGDGIPDKIFAQDGECAFQMKGVGSVGKIQQNVSTDGILAGDSLEMYAYVQGKNAVEGGQVRLKIKYVDENIDKTKLALTVAPGTYDYVYVIDQANVASLPSKLKVDVRYTGVGGKVLVDAVYLYLNVPLPRDDDGRVLLPDASTNNLGNREGNAPNRLGSRQ